MLYFSMKYFNKYNFIYTVYSCISYVLILLSVMFSQSFV